MRMTDPHQGSVSLLYYLVLSILIPVPISAWPTTTFYRKHDGSQQLVSGSNTAASPIPSSPYEKQTTTTAQVFNMFGRNTTKTCILTSTPTILSNGDTATIVSKNCTCSFTVSSNPSDASVSVMSSTNLFVTDVSSTASAATNAVSPSMFVTAALAASTLSSIIPPTPSATLTNAPIISSMSTFPLLTSPNDSPPYVASSSSSSFAVTLGSPTSSPDAFTSSTQSHLSSLPIFLGSFGGIAGLALLTVALKVYRPWENFHRLGLCSLGFVRRLEHRQRYLEY